MAFTAENVKELREITGVGLMDCKKALTESGGDMEGAIALLRERGLAAAQKKAGRVAAEGVAYAAVIGDAGVVVEVNAETDFVAKNDTFMDFVKGVAQVIAESAPADLDELTQKGYPGENMSVGERRQEMVLRLGENISIRRFARYTGLCIPYVHAGGKIGVLVSMEADGITNPDALTELGKDIAMQIAAMRPTYLDSSSVSQTELDGEREIQLRKALEENRAKNLPEDKARQIAENMVKGRMNKYFEEICLLNQPYVKENKMTVEQHIKNVAKSLGGAISVKAFTRFERGEGIEKKQEDFAAEIAGLVRS
jgi:elongation factor Ts